MMFEDLIVRPLFWVGSARDELKGFPEEVRGEMGNALYIAQTGGKHPNAKPLKGFGGAGVLEVADDSDGATYRTVYTVKLADAVYVLHAFQKKSKRGSATPKRRIQLVTERLRQAREHYRRMRERTP